MAKKASYEELEQKVKELEKQALEHFRHEDDLKESEEKYRSMMEAMNEATYICSSDYRVEYMNPMMIKRTGYDATGELCHKAINGLDELCPWCVHEKVQQGKSVQTEILSPKDGRNYICSHSPIFHIDGSISKMTVYKDLTEFKQTEDALRESKDNLDKAQSIGRIGSWSVT